MRATFVCFVLAVAALLPASPASAQYRPRPLNDPATGETYIVEGSAGLWFPNADMSVTSAGTGALAGIPGSQINAESDLGFPSSKTLPEFEVVLRPARSQKLRLQFVPIQYDGSNTVTRDIVFNGQRYRFGTLVNSTMDWKAWRFGYEYDFITRNRGFGGFILDVKYTDVRVDLNAPQLGLAEFAHARAPIPAIGGIARVYVVPNVAITGEVTGFRLPTIQDKYAGHYVDVDVYGTLNFTNNIGVKGGWRTLDMGYLAKQDTGSFTLNGVYVAAVVRY